jgi:hypothetical protein
LNISFISFFNHKMSENKTDKITLNLYFFFR